MLGHWRHMTDIHGYVLGFEAMTKPESPDTERYGRAVFASLLLSRAPEMSGERGRKGEKQSPQWGAGLVHMLLERWFANR